MKRVIKIIALFLSLFILFVTHLAFAETKTKTFVKEYSYQASDEDSKNSSRVIALREVKRLLLEELGTYLESETEVKNFQLTKDRITTLTAGIVQTEIIAEKWDGHVYWLKSKITADSDKVVQSISQLRKDREKTNELEAMRKKSDELLREVERLRKEMVSAKDGNRVAQKAAYDKSIKELSAAEWIEKGHAVSDYHDDFKGALDAYSRAIELDPTSIKAYYFRARISEKEQAMLDYHKILSIEAKDSESHLIRAWTYKELDQRDPAFREFGKAIEKASGNKEKAIAYYDRGRFYTLFEPIPLLEPTKQTIPNARELSIQDVSRAIELDPKEASYYVLRAGSNSGLQEYDLAIQDLSRAIEIEPNDSYYSIRGQAWRNLKKWELAVADYSRAIELAPKDSLFVAHDYMMRAFTYEHLGKFDLAIRDWSKLIELQPKESMNHRNRADLYVKVGKHDAALKDYDKAIALKPQEEDASYYGSSLIFARRGNVQKAVQNLTKAIQFNAEYKEKARSEAGFDSIRRHPDFIKLIGK